MRKLKGDTVQVDSNYHKDLELLLQNRKNMKLKKNFQTFKITLLGNITPKTMKNQKEQTKKRETVHKNNTERLPLLSHGTSLGDVLSIPHNYPSWEETWKDLFIGIHFKWVRSSPHK